MFTRSCVSINLAHHNNSVLFLSTVCSYQFSISEYICFSIHDRTMCRLTKYIPAHVCVYMYTYGIHPSCMAFSHWYTNTHIQFYERNTNKNAYASPQLLCARFSLTHTHTHTFSLCKKTNKNAYARPRPQCALLRHLSRQLSATSTM
jgi:hypothetical protein